jgi:hypothetical protein
MKARPYRARALGRTPQCASFVISNTTIYECPSSNVMKHAPPFACVEKRGDNNSKKWVLNYCKID